MMTSDELEELRALSDAATPGPWTREHDGPSRPIIVTPLRMLTLNLLGNDGPWYEREEEDAAFIAAARTAVPTLLDDGAALRGERDEARSEIERFQAGVLGAISVMRNNKSRPRHSLGATVMRKLEKLMQGRTPKSLATLSHKVATLEEALTTRDAEIGRARMAVLDEVLAMLHARADQLRQLAAEMPIAWPVPEETEACASKVAEMKWPLTTPTPGAR